MVLHFIQFLPSFDLQSFVLCVGISRNITVYKIEIKVQGSRQKSNGALHEDRAAVFGLVVYTGRHVEE